MSDTVEKIKERLSILDVIAPYVALQKAGKNFKGKSPFSAEKTPSFYVSPDRGMYYCFSTSQGGDMFSFIQAIEGVDFKTALKQLAEKAGVELVPEKPEARTARERSYAVLAAAAAFYEGWRESHAAAAAYLTARGVSPLSIARWQIGYAPGPPVHGWRHAKEHLEAAGYTTDELLRVGLVKHTDGGKQPYDVFRDRIMFPLFDSSGRVVAFSGRVLSKDSDAPKYVNSPETELYKKSSLLYGYDKAKQGIRKLDFSLIVEGQFDVVLCHQAGYTNTVAVSGTALTLEHVQQLERLSRRVVLALDADRAGIAAMRRAAQLMLARGIDIKIAELPEGKDPADLIAENPAEFKAVVKRAVHVIEFLLHVLVREVSDERSRKVRVRTDVLPFVLLIPNRIEQEYFVKQIATAIESTVEAVRFEIERLRAEPPAGATLSVDVPKTAGAVANVHELYSYTRGLIARLPAAEQVVAQATLRDITQYAIEPLEHTEASEARALFADDVADSVLKETIILNFNRLRQTLLQRTLETLKMKQRAAEADGAVEASLALAAELHALSLARQTPPFDSELFSSAKH